MPSPAPNRRYRSWLVNILLVAAVFMGVQWWKARPLARGPAPALAGTLLDGRSFALEGSRTPDDARPMLIHFWATWCPACRLGQRAIDAVAADHRVITVAMQSGDPMEVRAYMAVQGIAFPVLADPDGALAGLWGVSGLPSSFVVDRTGRIRFATVGLTTEAGLRIRLWLADQLE
jgi:thiol-disulfide isomerase/thioredoxin